MTQKEADLSPHPVIGLALQVEDVEKFLQTFVGRVQFGHTPMVMECQIRQRQETVSNLFNSVLKLLYLRSGLSFFLDSVVHNLSSGK